MKNSDKHAVRDLRDLSLVLIETTVTDLRSILEEPKAVMVNILTREDPSFSHLSQRDKETIRSQGLANIITSMRNQMEKTVKNVALYEQVIRICDNLLEGKYEAKAVIKDVKPE